MQERRLAAIMLVFRSEKVGGPVHCSLFKDGFSEFVEYTALTEGDTNSTIEKLCRNREILRPAIDKHKGEYPEESLGTNYQLIFIQL